MLERGRMEDEVWTMFLKHSLHEALVAHTPHRHDVVAFELLVQAV
jgi:hypothetical protein